MNIITICGNIGSGKSTVMNMLRKSQNEHQMFKTPLCKNNFSFIDEPIDKWGDWLKRFYQDPTKHSLGFQLKILNTYNGMFVESSTKDVMVTERSPYESIFIFSELLKTNNTLSKEEYDVLLETYDYIGWTPNVFIYINTSPEECIRRINVRSRKCESKIDEQYVYDLHAQYEHIMNTTKNRVFTINGDRSLEHVYANIADILISYNTSLVN